MTNIVKCDLFGDSILLCNFVKFHLFTGLNCKIELFDCKSLSITHIELSLMLKMSNIKAHVFTLFVNSYLGILKYKILNSR